MAERDLAYLIGLAVALIEKKPCPVCNAISWKSTDTTVDLPLANTEQPAPCIPVVCGGCGWVTLFMCTFLDRKASELNAKGMDTDAFRR